MTRKLKGSLRAYKEWASLVKSLQQDKSYTCKNQWQSYSKSYIR